MSKTLLHKNLLLSSLLFGRIFYNVLHGLVNHSVDKDASLEWKISAGMYGVFSTFSKIPAQFCTLTPLGWGESMRIMIWSRKMPKTWPGAQNLERSKTWPVLASLQAPCKMARLVWTSQITYIKCKMYNDKSVDLVRSQLGPKIWSKGPKITTKCPTYSRNPPMKKIWSTMYLENKWFNKWIPTVDLWRNWWIPTVGRLTLSSYFLTLWPDFGPLWGFSVKIASDFGPLWGFSVPIAYWNLS